MAQGQINELFYSNGVDIFGPVNIEEFSKNRYYKSTMIWYEGLAGWISIEDCKDLEHLIGTLSTPILNSGLPQALPDLTPPLSKKMNGSASSKRKNIAIFSLAFVVVLLLVIYSFNNKPIPQQVQIPIPKDTIAQDSTIFRENEIVNTIRSEAEMKTYRMNWEKFITVIPNDFRRKEIGGIENLKVILKNNSPYSLDSVKVKVVYIKANGDNYLTEIMQFDNVPANDSKELFAPNSNRGVKVNCSIISVYSNAMNLCFSKKERDASKNIGEDLYKCN